MNEDRSGVLAGLAVFAGAIGGLFLVARVTHFIFAVVKDPERLMAVSWTQAGMIVLALLLAACVVALVRSMRGRRHRPHDPSSRYAASPYSGRAA
ncbi:hypothetical protein GJ689_16585 [Rhodoplanes serenus]|uniref:Uncharacterized protein n=1 Tax=Rhodoplanes serenus TaxID=200615 RepID=A0A9X4XPD8_9BRAD|nr:hypothetical protein [Rhodoplanes serenus]MTW17826.1 hypothetical protein [Rhodoplanes serenus]